MADRVKFFNQFDPSLSKQIEDCRRAIAKAAAALQLNPEPDVFLGRKTQEPFPKEEE